MYHHYDIALATLAVYDNTFVYWPAHCTAHMYTTNNIYITTGRTGAAVTAGKSNSRGVWQCKDRKE